MKIKIGEKIKELRKRHNVTQDKLAEYLSMTPQAVSRWENEDCYPDVDLFPAIANYFNITIDDLFESDKKTEKLKNFKDEIYKKDVQGFSLEAIEIYREALKEFPNNYDIISTLIGLLDTKNNKDEKIELCERILNDCEDSRLKKCTLRDLALIYRDTEDYIKAEETAKKLPDICDGIFLSQELWLARLLRGEEKLFKSRQVIYWLMESLGGEIKGLVLNSRAFCGGDYKTGAKECIDMLERNIKLYELIFSDGDYGFYNLRFHERYSDIAEEYLYLEDYNNAIDCIEKAANYLIAFENNNSEFLYTSFLIRGYTNSAGFWHHSPETMSYQVIHDYYLKEERFLPIRENARFKAVIEKLIPYAKEVQYNS